MALKIRVVRGEIMSGYRNQKRELKNQFPFYLSQIGLHHAAHTGCAARRHWRIFFRQVGDEGFGVVFGQVNLVVSLAQYFFPPAI